VTDPNPLWAIHTAVHRTGSRADSHAIGEVRPVLTMVGGETVYRAG
jgi:predicted amidohydrolase YtcJ